MSRVVLNRPMVKMNLDNVVKNYFYHMDSTRYFDFGNASDIHLGDVHRLGSSCSNFLLVTEDYLNLIDKFNKLSYENGFKDYARNKLFNSDDKLRIGYFTDIINSNPDLFDENDLVALAQSKALDLLDYYYLRIYTDYQDDYIVIKYNKPVGFRDGSRWVNSEINPNNKKLYLLSPVGLNVTYPGEVDIYSQHQDRVVNLVSYIAWEIGDANSDADIIFDHIDYIDYFDSLELAVKMDNKI